MNYKTLILLGGAFVVLVIAVLLVKPNRPQVGSGVNAEVGKVLVKDFNVDDARTVKLAKGDRQIQLAKKNGRWVVASKADRPADDERVKSLLRALSDAKVKEDRRGSPETFELDEKRRLTIDVAGADDKSLAHVVAGKSPDFATGFVMEGDTGRVLLVDQNFGEKAQVVTENDAKVLSEDKWYDLKLLRITSGDVIDVAFQQGDRKWRIQKVIPGEGPVKPQSKDAEKKDAAGKDEVKTEATAAEGKAEEKDEAKVEEKKDSEKADEPTKDAPKADEKKEAKKEPVWRVTDPQDVEANESECNSVCSALAWLDAKGYADEVKPEEQGFDKPVATTHVVLKDGTTHTIVFGKFVKNEKNETDSYAIAKLDDKPQVWKVDKYAFENLTKPVDKLKKEEKKDEPKAEEKKADAGEKTDEGAAQADEKKDEPKAEEKAEPKKEEPKDDAKTDEKPAEK